MAELLYVVSRDSLDIYDYLRRSFADVTAVVVVLDRRQGERRRAARLCSDDRRLRDRRDLDVNGDLETLGWALVRRDDRGVRQSGVG